jgi:hypothetical protein
LKQKQEQLVVHVESLEEAPVAVAECAAANDGEPAQGEFLHARLSLEEQSQLDTVLGWMVSEPPSVRRRRLADHPREKLSYAGAIRFALRRCVEEPPAHVSGG